MTILLNTLIISLLLNNPHHFALSHCRWVSGTKIANK